MTLQATLDAIRHEFETNQAPPEAVATMHAQRDALIASGLAERAVGVGQGAPDFTLPGPDGDVSLAELRAEGPVVLTWFRGTW